MLHCTFADELKQTKRQLPSDRECHFAASILVPHIAGRPLRNPLWTYLPPKGQISRSGSWPYRVLAARVDPCVTSTSACSWGSIPDTVASVGWPCVKRSAGRTLWFQRDLCGADGRGCVVSVERNDEPCGGAADARREILIWAKKLSCARTLQRINCLEWANAADNGGSFPLTKRTGPREQNERDKRRQPYTRDNESHQGRSSLVENQRPAMAVCPRHSSWHMLREPFQSPDEGCLNQVVILLQGSEVKSQKNVRSRKHLLLYAVLGTNVDLQIEQKVSSRK